MPSQNTRPSPQPSLNVKQILVSTLSLGMIILAGMKFWQDSFPEEPPTYRTYYYQPLVDNQYENPANWQPSYPGTHILADQKVFIQGLANLPFYDLTIAGTLFIGIDGELFGPKQQVTLLTSGTLNNDGSILLDGLQSQGKISNNFTGKISCNFFHNLAEGETFNLQGSTLEAIQRLENIGKFHNYGLCNARDQFENYAVFNQLGQATLVVKGEPLQMATTQSLDP